jgi:hypothetical protein
MFFFRYEDHPESEESKEKTAVTKPAVAKQEKKKTK